MRILIIYYSRTGTTRKVAEKLRSRLNCDLEEIIDLKDRMGAIGYILSGRDAVKKKMTEITASKLDSAAYDLVIIGTPVWFGLMAPAVRTWLNRNKDKIKKLACFTTQGSAARQRVFDEMSAYTGLPLEAELYVRTKEVVKAEYESKLEEFAKKLSQAFERPT